MTPATELAWAAGFFDGEGNTQVHYPHSTSGRKYASLGMNVGQSEGGPLPPDTLIRFRDAVEVGRIAGPYFYPKQGMTKNSWQWRAYGQEARQALRLMWPYLSTPKRAQAEMAIDIVNVWRARG